MTFENPVSVREYHGEVFYGFREVEGFIQWYTKATNGDLIGAYTSIDYLAWINVRDDGYIFVYDPADPVGAERAKELGFPV